MFSCAEMSVTFSERVSISTLGIVDKVFVLDLDTETLKQRLDSRTADDWGGNKKERELILRLHATKEDIPDGMIIDAARPLNEVLDAIVECIEV